MFMLDFAYVNMCACPVYVYPQIERREGMIPNLSWIFGVGHRPSL